MKMKYKRQQQKDKNKYGTTATMEEENKATARRAKKKQQQTKLKNGNVCVERRNRWTDPSGIIEIRRNLKTATERCALRRDGSQGRTGATDKKTIAYFAGAK